MNIATIQAEQCGRVRSRKAIVHRLYVIKIFPYSWFSQPLGSNSFPTKENRVGEIFIIVIVKQNAIILAKVCNLLNNAFARFYNNAELFKHFVLITHDQGEG